MQFLGLSDVLAILDDQLHLYGGIKGIRDGKMLDSAISMPKAMFGGKYLHKTVPAMAAAYAFHICQNHPFLDGNKRAALMCSLVFLEWNSYELIADDDTLFNEILGLASGNISKEELAKFYEEHAVPF